MTLKADQLKNYRKSILEFIEYLYENRGYMKDDVKTIESIRRINGKQGSLKPKEKYKDAKEFENLEVRKDDLRNNLTWDNLIRSKAKELNLYKWNSVEIVNELGNGLEFHLKSGIKPAEEEKIIEAKEKYLTFRKDTNFCEFSNGFLFWDLDRALTPFFGAFTDVSDMKRTQPEPPAPQPEVDPVEPIINKFNSDSIENIKKHFRDLEKDMKNGEFEKWIKQAFELKKPPKEKFKLTGKHTISEIRKLFHTYWKIEGVRGEKDKYVKLLSEYFEGFPFKNTTSNFSK